MSRACITVFGEVLWDLFHDGAKFGGAPANYAAHAQALGAEVCLVSAVGDDPLGGQALERLAGLGIETWCVSVHRSLPTGVVEVTLDSAGQPAYEIAASCAWDAIELSPVAQQRLGESRAIYFGTLAQRHAETRATIRHALQNAPGGCARVLDINLRSPWFDDALIRDSIGLATILKLSEEELPTVMAAVGCPVDGSQSEQVSTLRERHDLELVVLSRGEKGALLVSADAISDTPGIPTVVADTVGAGDAFTAAMTVAWLEGYPLDEINRHACRVAAFVCSQRGGTPKLPDELLRRDQRAVARIQPG